MNSTLKQIAYEIDVNFRIAKFCRQDVKEDSYYQTAKILISAFNKLVKLYYPKDQQAEYLLKSVDKEYKKFLENYKEEF